MGYNRERQHVPLVVLVVTGVIYVAYGAISGTTVTRVSDICGADKLHPSRILSLERVISLGKELTYLIARLVHLEGIITLDI